MGTTPVSRPTSRRACSDRLQFPDLSRDRFERQLGSCDSAATESVNDLHITLGFLESIGPLGRVVDDPLGESDGAFNLKSVIIGVDCEGRLVYPAFHVSSDRSDPRFDSRVASVGGNIDLRLDPDVLFSNGAGI